MRETGGWVEVPFEVQKPRSGLRLDRFLADRLRGYSRSRVQDIIAQGRVFLRSKTAESSDRVRHGDVVLIRYPQRQQAPPIEERLAPIYEDTWLLAVNKPAGMLSHPTDTVLRNCVTSVLKAQHPAWTPRLAHRLDRETSGVLLLAKDAGTARDLTEQFTRRLVRKQYLAIVLGRVPFSRRLVELPLGREGLGIKVRQRVADAGASAATEFRRLAAAGDHSLVSAIPRTGRLHQIRVHLAAIGHPVVGDKLYTGGGEFYLKACRHAWAPEDASSLGAERQMLHARRLRLRHPATGSPLTITAPLPQDFRARLRSLGLPCPR